MRKADAPLPFVEFFIDRFMGIFQSQSIMEIIFSFERKDTLELLIRNKVLDVNTTLDSSLKPLHAAVARYSFSKKQTNMIQFLIKNGADVNARDGIDLSPLHYAVSSNRDTVIAKLLIQNGADVNAENKFGPTPLQLAKISKNKNMVKLLSS